jgi:arginine decarboxylase-like protein
MGEEMKVTAPNFYIERYEITPSNSLSKFMEKKLKVSKLDQESLDLSVTLRFEQILVEDLEKIREAFNNMQKFTELTLK